MLRPSRGWLKLDRHTPHADLQSMSWLHRMTSLGLSGVLADDMGLGKTITLIALHLHRQTHPATAAPSVPLPVTVSGPLDGIQMSEHHHVLLVVLGLLVVRASAGDQT